MAAAIARPIDDIRRDAIRDTHLLVGSMGPVSAGDIEAELLTQTVGVTKENVCEIAQWTIQHMLTHDSIEPYEMFDGEDDDERTFVLTEREMDADPFDARR